MTFSTEYQLDEDIDYDFMSQVGIDKDESSEESLEEILDTVNLYKKFLVKNRDFPDRDVEFSNNNFNQKDYILSSWNSTISSDIESLNETLINKSFSNQTSGMQLSLSNFNLSNTVLPMDSDITINSFYGKESNKINEFDQFTGYNKTLYPNSFDLTLAANRNEEKKIETKLINITVLPSGQHEATIDLVLLNKEHMEPPGGNNDGVVEPNALEINTMKNEKAINKAFSRNKIDKNVKKKKQLKQDKPVQCTHCNKHFQSICHWKRHNESVHLNVRNFECVRCGMFFKRKDQLVQHKNRKNRCEIKL